MSLSFYWGFFFLEVFLIAWTFHFLFPTFCAGLCLTFRVLSGCFFQRLCFVFTLRGLVHILIAFVLSLLDVEIVWTPSQALSIWRNKGHYVVKGNSALIKRRGATRRWWMSGEKNFLFHIFCRFCGCIKTCCSKISLDWLIEGRKL